MQPLPDISQVTAAFPVHPAQTDSALSFLGWAVSILVAGILGLWVRSERKSADQQKELVNVYVAQVGKLEGKLESSEKTNGELQQRLFDTERKHAEDSKAMALEFMRLHGQEWDDIPTGVAHHVVQAASERQPQLQPRTVRRQVVVEEVMPPPRGRAPSRTDR